MLNAFCEFNSEQIFYAVDTLQAAGTLNLITPGLYPQFYYYTDQLTNHNVFNMSNHCIK